MFYIRSTNTGPQPFFACHKYAMDWEKTNLPESWIPLLW
jgi:hypothetical protein